MHGNLQAPGDDLPTEPAVLGHAPDRRRVQRPLPVCPQRGSVSHATPGIGTRIANLRKVFEAFIGMINTERAAAAKKLMADESAKSLRAVG